MRERLPGALGAVAFLALATLLCWPDVAHPGTRRGSRAEACAHARDGRAFEAFATGCRR